MNSKYVEQEIIPVYRARVLTGPQVCFPFPGEAEVNIVVELFDLEAFGDDAPSAVIVPVIIDESVPVVGAQIEVREYYDFYYGKRDGLVRDVATSRYHIKY